MSRITRTRLLAVPRMALIGCATVAALAAAVPQAHASAPPTAAAAAVQAPAPAQAQQQPPPAPPVAQASQFHDRTIRRSPRQEAARSAAAQSNNATATTGERPAGLDLPRVGLSLGAVLGAILVLRWFGTRFFAPAKAAGRASRAVQVLARAPLSPRQQLVLLQVGRRLVLVADGGAQANTLCEITDPDEVAALVGQLNEDRFRATGGKPFGSVFGRFRRRYDADDEAASRALAPEAFADDEAGERAEADEDGPGVGRVLARATASVASAAEPDEPAVAEARQELNGLLEKVRLITKQYKAPS